MLFRREKIGKEHEVDKILRMGLTGLKKFNSWPLTEGRKIPKSYGRNLNSLGRHRIFGYQDYHYVITNRK